MAKKLLRLYNGLTNAEMLNMADVIHDMFEKDMALFENFNSELNNAFKIELAAKINIARKHPTDEAVVRENELLTKALRMAHRQCKIHFSDAKYFIEQAFSGTPVILTFGYEDYRKMAVNQNNVIPFMDQFHTAATNNKIALIDKGYTQAKIDDIVTLTEAFRTARREQQLAKKERPVITKERTEKMNEVWKMLRRINRASKKIFKNNYAKLTNYELPAAKKIKPLKLPE